MIGCMRNITVKETKGAKWCSSWTSGSTAGKQYQKQRGQGGHTEHRVSPPDPDILKTVLLSFSAKLPSQTDKSKLKHHSNFGI